MSDYIKEAYDEAKKFVQNKNIEVSVLSDDYFNEEILSKIKSSIYPASNFWANLFKKDLKLIVVCSTEKSYEWLRERLEEHNFLSAMPDEDRISAVGDVGVTGGGGLIEKDGEETLFLWQVVGTKSTFSNTGEIKTPAHLFAHAAQGYIFNTKTLKMTDLPPWIIEGQSDYSALYSISKDFEEFLEHRKNFAKIGFVPGQNTREIFSKRDDIGWFKSLSEAPIPFEGIPIVDEYYSGFFCYEKLLSLIGFEKIKEMLYKVIDGQEFNAAFQESTNKHITDFYRDMSFELEALSKRILVF